MPTINENKQIWTEGFDWSGHGEEWSEPYGGVDMQWYGSLLPRIHSFVPAGTILEMAPGFGRWANYMRNLCSRLILVDLSEKCIDACRQRFRECQHVECHVNDGQSIPMVADHSVDFVFSFDSLVHADEPVMRAYAHEWARVLKKDGVGFVHHSNYKPFGRYVWMVRRLRPLWPILLPLRLIENLDPPSRDLSMSAERFREHLAEAGLVCVGQEIIPWGTNRLIDCITTFAAPSRSVRRRNEVVANKLFRKEAEMWKRVSPIYGVSDSIRPR